MVQRYKDVGYGWDGMDAGDAGDAGEYVKYEDYAALENAVNALLADVKARHPNQDLYCPLMRELERLTK